MNMGIDLKVFVGNVVDQTHRGTFILVRFFIKRGFAKMLFELRKVFCFAKFARRLGSRKKKAELVKDRESIVLFGKDVLFGMQ